jgi:hemerythrin-like domain-containing protein
MRATDSLRAEHRVIEQVLDCLECVVTECIFEGQLDLDVTREVLRFFQNFADRCHHGKEEAHLFPLLEAHGVPRDGGPIGRMLAEHDEGREHLRALAALLEATAAGDPPARRHFAEQAWAYTEGLREHIYKEDNFLFPVADRLLTNSERQRLHRCFARVERREMGPGTHERYLALANRLADRCGVPHALAASAGCGCHAQG